MKIYTFYTDSHSDLFDNYFLPSVPKNLEVVAKKLPQECSGVFMDSCWMKTMTRKLDYVLESIRECWGGVFIHSDCDVQFFGPFLENILNQLGDKDLAGQAELKQSEICCGFFICRANEKTENLFKAVKSLVNDKENDQIVLNKIKEQFVDWKTLDGRYFSAIHFLGFGKTWSPGDEVKIERNDILMHHANWTIGIENKKKLMGAVRQKVQSQTLGKFSGYLKYI